MPQQKNRGTIDIMHERFCRKALRKTNGHKRKAAELLGISERNLYHKINKYDIKYKKGDD